MSQRPSPRSRLLGAPSLGTIAPLVPGLWRRPFGETVPFEPGSATPGPEAEAALDGLAQALSWFVTSCGVELAGFAGSEGGSEEEHRLSLARAEAVREGLTQRGIPPWLMRIRGYGAEASPRRGRRVEPSDRGPRVELWLHHRVMDAAPVCDDPAGEGCCRAC
jgi:outer membrane protein OmpA-like peptidoglycan-associated protein